MALNEESNTRGLGREAKVRRGRWITEAPQTTSEQAVPIPIVYGTCKVPVNVIEMLTPSVGNCPIWTPATQYYVDDRVINGDRRYICVVAGVSASTPPGPQSEVKAPRQDGTAQWKFEHKLPSPIYIQNFIGVVCEGEIKGGLRTWWDRRVNDTHSNLYVSPGSPYNGSLILSNRLRLFVGRDAVDQQFPATPAFDSSAYQHTAVLFGKDISTGTQNELPELAIEVEGIMFGSSVPDVNPADILVDLLTHDRRGLGAILPSSVIGSSITGSGATTFRTYCDAAGLRISMLIDTQRPVLQLIAAILAATNSVACWSGGELKIRPLSDQAITSPVYGSTSYVPDNAAAYDLGPDDFLGKGKPVVISRRSDADCYNAIPVEYTDRGAGYARVTVEDAEMTDVELRGLRRASPASLDVVFPDGKAAVLLSRTFAQRSLFVRNEYRFRLPWRYSLLEPTDIVTLTEPAIGLSMVPVIITSLDEGEDGSISFTAIDYPEGVSAAKTYTPQVGDGYTPNVEATTQALPTLVDGVNIGLENVVLGRLAMSNWTERANPKNRFLRGIAWSTAYSRYIAVGLSNFGAEDAYIVSSTDGARWIEQANPKNMDLWGITYADALRIVVAVGQADGTDAYIVTSTGGATWTERANPKNVTLRAVAWSSKLNLLAAVGNPDGTDAYIVTSTDGGVTWTERANPKNVTLRAVAWSSKLNMLAAVGDSDGTDAYIVTSTDGGVTWTERANPKNVSLYGISWSPKLELFVSVGDPDGTDAYIITSTDGKTWTERSNPDNLPLYAVTWIKDLGLFLSVGYSDTSEEYDAYIITSFDGKDWTEHTNPKNIGLYAIAWSPRLLTAVCVGQPDGSDAYIISSMSFPEKESPNLAANPSFEEGDLYWEKESTWQIVNDATNARSGGWCAKAINPVHSGIYNGAYNSVPASPGDAFYAEAWIKSSAGATANCYVRITWVNGSGTHLGYSNGNTVSATTSYQKSSVTGAAPAGTVYAILTVVVAVGGSTGTWYVDDVIFRAL